MCIKITIYKFACLIIFIIEMELYTKEKKKLFRKTEEEELIFILPLNLLHIWLK